MSAADRRDALVEATIPLLKEHGRAVTTRQIAEAAGIAEGTIFRVFDSKEELVDEAVQSGVAWGDFPERIQAIDPSLPLEARLLCLVTLMQKRFQSVFGLMRAVGIVGPPPGKDRAEHMRGVERVREAMIQVVEPDAARLTSSPAEVVNLLRLLTFSGSHPEMSQGHLLKPADIVGVVLHGVLKENP